MKIKDYKLSKTLKKTARENQLLISSNNAELLIDISILDDIDLIIPDTDMEEIKNHISKYLITWYSNEEMFFIRIDNFTAYDIRVKLANHRIFNAVTGKRRYVITQITNMRIQKLTRTNVYDDYTVAEQILKTYYTDSPDIEI